MMLVEVYEACGDIPHLEIPFYPADWKLHRDAERHLDGRHAVRDRNFGAATARRRRGFSLHPLLRHGAIVVKWPWIISRAG